MVVWDGCKTKLKRKKIAHWVEKYLKSQNGTKKIKSWEASFSNKFIAPSILLYVKSQQKSTQKF